MENNNLDDEDEEDDHNVQDGGASFGGGGGGDFGEFADFQSHSNFETSPKEHTGSNSERIASSRRASIGTKLRLAGYPNIFEMDMFAFQELITDIEEQLGGIFAISGGGDDDGDDDADADRKGKKKAFFPIKPCDNNNDTNNGDGNNISSTFFVADFENREIFENTGLRSNLDSSIISAEEDEDDGEVKSRSNENDNPIHSQEDVINDCPIWYNLTGSYNCRPALQFAKSETFRRYISALASSANDEDKSNQPIAYGKLAKSKKLRKDGGGGTRRSNRAIGDNLPINMRARFSLLTARDFAELNDSLERRSIGDSDIDADDDDDGDEDNNGDVTSDCIIYSNCAKSNKHGGDIDDGDADAKNGDDEEEEDDEETLANDLDMHSLIITTNDRIAENIREANRREVETARGSGEGKKSTTAAKNLKPVSADEVIREIDAMMMMNPAVDDDDDDDDNGLESSNRKLSNYRKQPPDSINCSAWSFGDDYAKLNAPPEARMKARMASIKSKQQHQLAESGGGGDSPRAHQAAPRSIESLNAASLLDAALRSWRPMYKADKQSLNHHDSDNNREDENEEYYHSLPANLDGAPAIDRPRIVDDNNETDYDDDDMDGDGDGEDAFLMEQKNLQIINPDATSTKATICGSQIIGNNDSSGDESFRRKLANLTIAQLNELYMELEQVIQLKSESLIQLLAARDELDEEKEVKNQFISLLLSVQNKRRHLSSNSGTRSAAGAIGKPAIKAKPAIVSPANPATNLRHLIRRNSVAATPKAATASNRSNSSPLTSGIISGFDGVLSSFGSSIRDSFRFRNSISTPSPAAAANSKIRKVSPMKKKPYIYLTTVIPYRDEMMPLDVPTLRMLIKLLTALNEDSNTVPALLTEYILKVICP